MIFSLDEETGLGVIFKLVSKTVKSNFWENNKLVRCFLVAFLRGSAQQPKKQSVFSKKFPLFPGFQQSYLSFRHRNV